MEAQHKLSGWRHSRSRRMRRSSDRGTSQWKVTRFTLTLTAEGDHTLQESCGNVKEKGNEARLRHLKMAAGMLMVNGVVRNPGRGCQPVLGSVPFRAGYCR